MSRFVLSALATLLGYGAAALTGCATVAPRFPTDVQTALAHDDMRRLETERFVIYYPASRRALVDRFLVRADRCARTLREHSLLPDVAKIVIVMPDAPFNNAFVAPDALGYEQVSVIPTYSTLDFSTAFGLPPDPGVIGCHELVHYVHFQQIAGFWGTFNKLFGPIYTPQLGFDPWFDEGLATHYEARLTPGVGRPVWPLFTGMFAAAYAGRSIGGGDLSSYARSAPVGHHYLVGSMFVRFLVERYGERPLWTTIENQAHAFTGWFFTGTFEHGFAVSFGDLLDEFARWVERTFPERPRPPDQRTLRVIGNDARYARGRDGTEAWVAEDVDAPPRLTVRDAHGARLADIPLVQVLPMRTLAIAAPLLTSGLSVTADGREVWLTAIDLAGTFQVTRLLRWRRGERGLTEVTRDLGPGATIDPTGSTYYYCEVDGDRWNLAAWDVRTRARRRLVDMEPGTYVVAAQVSPDGKRLAASVWDGSAFVIWVVDAASGQIVQKIGSAGAPVFDASFASDGRLLHLGVVEGRFQVFVDGAQVTNAPYAVLAAREANGTIRFLDRERWSWELAEVAMPRKRLSLPPPTPAEAPLPGPTHAAPESSDATVPSASSASAPGASTTAASGASNPLAQGASSAAAGPAATSPSNPPAPGASSPAAGPAATSPPQAASSPAAGPAAGPAATSASNPPAQSASSPTAPAPAPAAAPTALPATQLAPVPPPPTATAGTPQPATTIVIPSGPQPTSALYPATPRPLPPPGSVPVLADERYSAFDHLFFPAVRSPTLVLAAPMPHVGLVLGGADRLDLQRWMLAGFVQPGTGGDPAHYGASAGYLNNMAAPVLFTAQGSFLDWVTPVADADDPMVTYDEEHRTRDLSAAIGYTHRGALTTTLGGVYTDDYAKLDVAPSSRAYVGGPSATLSWYAAETTRYTGPRRAVLADAQVAYYPRQLSTFRGDVTDLGGTLGFVAPLPLGRRHTISGFVRARSLLTEGETGLLQVGGDSALGLVWSRSNQPPPPGFDTSRFPPNLRFVEPLRGFEDFALASDRVKLGELSWKYPLIIDRGTATTLWVFPASYLRQLDLELFGTAAIVDANDRHYAVGAALTLRIQLLRVPLVVMYQIARRLSDDLALTQLVGIGPDL